MRYLPHTDEDVSAMLEAVGLKSLDDLFRPVPAAAHRTEPLNLPEPMTEWELTDLVTDLADQMAGDHTLFLGAGSYEHFIPASIQYLLGRSEFVTSYTPYQPEVSQGTLQAIFEYQTLVSRLLGMELANASLYDGASALAEAMLMSIRVTRKKKVAVSRCVHPNYRRVAATYLSPTDYEIVELPYTKDGVTDLAAAADLDDLAAVVVQSPNFFGCIEDVAAAAKIAHEKGALLIHSFTEPLAFGLYKNPGSLGADIACGEGQSFGLPRSFGGPGVGMFASLMKYVRNVPGRLIGETKDLEGQRGFVLTLATREQHIRREKAVSNICTNASLCALTTAAYMASLGKTGLGELAKLNYDKAEYAKAKLKEAGCGLVFERPTFNEFVVKFPQGSTDVYGKLKEKKILAGLNLETYFPELDGCYLLCVTETRTREEIDRLAREVNA